MRGLRLFFWGGALAISTYGLARLCLLGRERRTREGNGAKDDTRAAVVGVDLPGPSFAEKVEAVRRLKRENRQAEAIALLLKLLAAAEEEAAGAGSGLAAWYYEQLAILYRKEKRFAEEVEIIERYLAAQAKLGSTPGKQLKNRLGRAKELLAG